MDIASSGSGSEGSEGIHAVLMCVDARPRPYFVVVLFPALITHIRKGSGDIGAESWFCKLGNMLLFAWLILGSSAQDQENASMSPDPFSSQRVGSENETNLVLLPPPHQHPQEECPSIARINCLLWILKSTTLSLNSKPNHS